MIYGVYNIYIQENIAVGDETRARSRIVAKLNKHFCFTYFYIAISDLNFTRNILFGK